MAVVLASVAIAGPALAQQNFQYCDQYARSEMERLYPSGGGAVAGAVGGGILGGIIAGATNNNVGGGVGIGAVGGLAVGSALWQQRRQQVYQAALNNCMYAQPVAAPAPPPPPPPPPPPTPYFARSTAASLNVRNAPGTVDTVVLFQVTPANVFQMLVCDNPLAGWCFIDFNGQQGYLSRAYTVPSG
jgi:hypothetical protein